MSSAPVWTIWKTDARTVRIAAAMRAFGVVGLTALLDALLDFWEARNFGVVEISNTPGDSFRCVVCNELIIGFAFLCADGCYACSSKCQEAHDNSYIHSAPSPDPAAPGAADGVSSRTHTGHTQECTE